MATWRKNWCYGVPYWNACIINILLVPPFFSPYFGNNAHCTIITKCPNIMNYANVFFFFVHFLNEQRVMKMYPIFNINCEIHPHLSFPLLAYDSKSIKFYQIMNLYSTNLIVKNLCHFKNKACPSMAQVWLGWSLGKNCRGRLRRFARMER